MCECLYLKVQKCAHFNISKSLIGVNAITSRRNNQKGHWTHTAASDTVQAADKQLNE